MNRLVDITELPREHGFPVGNYIFRYSTLSVQSPGATLVDGETTEPVSGRTLQRLRGAYGSTSEIEPADEETILLVAAHLEAMGRDQRAAEVRASADPRMAELREKLDEWVNVEDLSGEDHDDIARMCEIMGVEADPDMPLDALKAAILKAGALRLAELRAEEEAILAEEEADRQAAAAEVDEKERLEVEHAARVKADSEAVAADEAAKRESFERAAIADSNAVAAQAGLVKAEEEAKAKEAADAVAAEEERMKAETMGQEDAARRAAEEADLPPIDAPAETPGTTPVESEANVAEAIAPVEPIIDDDIDTIDEPDILRAIASGLGLDPEGKDMPALKVAIRKARETG